ncbi:hypothetical protein J2810_004602 [Chryseobacterium rhizosphaerae]|uniref:hypothetical protein n=1 Tax=Chryseobacterium rhizosphaerae TaxID=395937 RepID=UPI002854E17C|nr:hypothetical protein [Chryseobacterium rhizosphaerae]MDR6548512.1 hypothetical protein [Chryseobacterium rhizosphaerae]
MGEIIKHLNSVEIKKKNSDEVFFAEIGDVIFDPRSDYRENIYTITKIQEELINNEYTRTIFYTDVERTDSKGNTYPETFSLDTISEYYQIYKGDKQEILDLADKVYSGELSLMQFMPKNESNSTDLMVMNKDFYDNALDQAKQMSQKVLIIQTVVKQKAQQLKDRISSEVAVFQKLVSKLQKIVFTLELYAGIGENIIQINEGSWAASDEKIHIMQNMLYMDEEVGDPENGGVSYKSVDKFYDWMRSYNKHLGYYNYELIIPYQKGVRVMRVRRRESERFSYDSFGNSFDYEISQEMKTCIIIRNGENIFVIHSQMNFKEKLFPTKEEFDEVLKSAKGDVELLLEKFTDYRYGMVLIQGILDRTPFLAEPQTVSVLNPNDSVIFEYDRIEISDGTVTFGNFLSTQNIEVGTRILALGLRGGGKYDRHFYGYYASEYSYPNNPENGIYEILRHPDKDNKDHLTISYVPDDTVYDRKKGYSKQRTKAVRFRILKDDNVVDFDLVSHKDLEWLENKLYDRRDRKMYLQVVPMLKALKKYKAEEYETERHFALMLCQKLEITEVTARDYIYWWKTKNKYKRAISKDDMKAIRMIEKKYKKDLEENNVFVLQPNISTK